MYHLRVLVERKVGITLHRQQLDIRIGSPLGEEIAYRGGRRCALGYSRAGGTGVWCALQVLIPGLAALDPRAAGLRGLLTLWLMLWLLAHRDALPG